MRWLALVLALLAVLTLPSGAIAAGSPAAADSPPVESAVAPTQAVESVNGFAQATATPGAPVTTEMTVQLRADRDARWRVEMRYPLTSGNETEAFRQYGRQFERGEAVGALDAETFEYLASASSTVANRQMGIQNVSRSATVSDGTGVLRLSFTWTAFLSADGEQLVLRDALRLPDDRTWLATLDPNQRLVIETPPGYAINSTNAPLVQRSGSIVVDGPRTFDTQEPLTIRYEQSTGVAGYPWEVVAGVGVALIVVVAMLVRRRQRPAAPAGNEPAPDELSSEQSAGAAGASGVAEADESEDEAESGAETGTEPEPDLSLLSDEERVEHLLERNGGRMRQADIVAETKWSDAKVSQLLSAMDGAGRIEKLRLGRENLISLPDEDGDDADEGADDGDAGPTHGDDRS